MSFIGIDVAKAQLEFACRPSGETGAVANDETGIDDAGGALPGARRHADRLRSDGRL